ncbi:MAG: hypothetical protein ACXABD_04465 [Candidatus Thorarchaeota archaeon]|jgi:hypothetical protein
MMTTDVMIDADTRLVLRLDSNDELISVSSPQYGDGEITPTFDLNSVGAIIKLVDPCGNKLTVDLVRKFDVLNLRNTFVVRWAFKEEIASA